MIIISLPFKQLELPFPKRSSDGIVTSNSIPPLQLTIKEIIEMYLYSPVLLDKYEIYSRLQKIIDCKTGKLGYHINICDRCATEESHPNSCNHSLCPECQTNLSERWIKARTPELLPVPYYQFVFSLPNKLNLFAMYNKKIVSDIFFKSVEKAMNEGPKRKGIEIGYISVLEFFAANLWFTPHMHIVVPGLGLLNNGKIQKFISKEYLPTSLEILKEEFCTEFLKRLEDEYLGKAETRKDLLKDEPEKINWPEELKELENNKDEFTKWIEMLKKEEWDVFIGDETKSDAKQLIKYVGKRAAIRDEQIIGANLKKVVFESEHNEKIELTLEEFIRRLANLEMPSRYHRIRNYGFLSNSVKRLKLKEIRQKLGLSEIEIEEAAESKCKNCGEGVMQTVALILPGQKIITFDKNIDKINIKPEWLSILETMDNKSREENIEKYDFLPDWLIELILSVD